MNNREKLNSLIADEKSTWHDHAAYRQQNNDWLSLSFDIAIRVLDTLRRKNMTQKELAERMHVSPQFVNKVIKGQENLSLETIAKLSNALGTKVIEIPQTTPIAEITCSVDQV